MAVKGVTAVGDMAVRGVVAVGGARRGVIARVAGGAVYI